MAGNLGCLLGTYACVGSTAARFFKDLDAVGNATYAGGFESSSDSVSSGGGRLHPQAPECPK